MGMDFVVQKGAAGNLQHASKIINNRDLIMPIVMPIIINQLALLLARLVSLLLLATSEFSA